jgi:hypothetical protein
VDEAKVPPRATLTAATDRSLAHFRDVRPDLERTPEGRFYLHMSTGLVSQMREEFPGTDTGRVLMAAMQSLKELRGVLAGMMQGDLADTVLSVGALAAEELAREEAGHG